jgi:hypothetical protein
MHSYHSQLGQPTVLAGRLDFLSKNDGVVNGYYPGRNLALLELRMVVAYIVQAFDMRFADAYDQRRWLHELEDTFVMKKGSLPVILIDRSM